MEYKDKHLRIDLGVDEQRVACPEHVLVGFAPGCRDCQETEPRKVRVPAMEGFFIEVLNPLLLPWGARKDLVARREDAKDTLARLNASEVIASRLVTAWNLVDVETGEPLPLPKDDTSVWDRAPSTALPYVMDVFQNGGGVAVPKETATA